MKHTVSRCLVGWLGVAALGLAWSASARAQHRHSWRQLPSDGGPLQWRGEEGLTTHIFYHAELGHNAAGGLEAGTTRYRGVAEILLQAGESVLPLGGGVIFALGQWVHGEGVSADGVGDAQLVSNFDAGNFVRLNELWYRQNLGPLTLKIGQQDANTNFALVEPALDMLHSSFGSPPNLPFGTYPDTAMGIAGFLVLPEDFYISLGLFDGRFASLLKLFDDQFSLFTDVEVGIPTPNLSAGRGILRAGFWHHGGDTTFVPESDYGFYGILEQPLWDTESGHLQSFGQYGWRHDGTNAWYAGGGAVFTFHKTQSAVGLGFAHADFTVGDETAIELYYRRMLHRFVALTADAQYVISPSGIHDDALAILIRLSLMI